MSKMWFTAKRQRGSNQDKRKRGHYLAGLLRKSGLLGIKARDRGRQDAGAGHVGLPSDTLIRSVLVHHNSAE
jgi:hypothetical protein